MRRVLALLLPVALLAVASGGPLGPLAAAPRPDIPEDLPLGLGLETDGDASVEGPGRDVPGVSPEDLCRSTAWPGPAGRSTDRLAVRESQGDYWQATRELVTYDTEAHATAVVAGVRRDLAGCPTSEGATVTAYDPETGHDSVTWSTRSGRSAVVVQLVRVGRAVIATTDHQVYADPTPDQLDNAVLAVTGELTPVTRLMECSWGADGCAAGDPLTLTPHGVAPFALGMDVARARTAGANAVIEGAGRPCAELSWTSPSGAHVHGAFSPGTGLAYLSISAGSTAEGVAVGGTLADLRATYPKLAHADNGLWYVDQGAADYAFEISPAHVIDWMLLIADDQHCVS